MRQNGCVNLNNDYHDKSAAVHLEVISNACTRSTLLNSQVDHSVHMHEHRCVQVTYAILKWLINASAEHMFETACSVAKDAGTFYLLDGWRLGNNTKDIASRTHEQIDAHYLLSIGDMMPEPPGETYTVEESCPFYQWHETGFDRESNPGPQRWQAPMSVSIFGKWQPRW